jgi:hypothetical protein
VLDKTHNTVTFSGLLRDWMAGASQREASDRFAAAGLRVDNVTIHGWLKGHSFPASTKVADIARVIGVDQQRLAMVIALDRGRKVAARLSRLMDRGFQAPAAEQVVESHVVSPGVDCGSGDAPSAAHDASVSNQASEVA